MCLQGKEQEKRFSWSLDMSNIIISYSDDLMSLYTRCEPLVCRDQAIVELIYRERPVQATESNFLPPTFRLS